MDSIRLPVRFTGDTEDQQAYTTLNLNIATTAFLLVDCSFENPAESPVGQVLRRTIAPTLAAVRGVGMPIIFIHGGDHNDSRSIHRELHATRRARTRTPSPWPLPKPRWIPGIEPLPGDGVIEKVGQNAFQQTSLDWYLRTNGIDTLLCVGFSFKSCLFYTLIGAAEHNYRAVFLRDGTHPHDENEFPDTGNPELAEKGWVRLVLTRLIEDHLGYSSTCEALVAACAEVSEEDR